MSFDGYQLVWRDKVIKQQAERIAALDAKLEIATTECKGYDCCPLANRLNEADDKVAELEKYKRCVNFIAAMDVRVHHISDPIKMARDTLEGNTDG